MELTAERPRRRFLLVIPAAQVAALHAARLAALGLTPPSPDAAPGQPAWSVLVRDRIAAGALADACRRAGEEAVAALLARLPPAIGRPDLDTLASPPDGDLILRAELWTLPDPVPPDPASLAIEQLVAAPDPAEEARALAALAATRASLAEQPRGTPALTGDTLVCDIDATLLPAENRIPQPGLLGAAAGAPGRLPDGWQFGDNGAGLAAEVLAVAPLADPPHLRLRVHGTAAADGQSFVIFHPARAIAVAPGANWVGSVALRRLGTPTGLRGAKLRLQSQTASGEGALRRKDAAAEPGEGPGFQRVYVSDRMHDAGTAFLRMPLLFDHASGPVDFTFDIAAPRLVEGLDLGEQAAVPLPEFAARGRRIRLDGAAPDPLGLLPCLAGIAAGETREIVRRLPDNLDDRALAGRQARFVIRVTALLRQAAPAPDEALARAMGFDGLEDMHAFVARRVAERHAALSGRQARRALLDALLAAAGPIPLPDPALRAEVATLWRELAEAARARGAEPPAAQTLAARAARRLRSRLLLGAVARRHQITPGADGTVEEPALAFLLARARITQRSVSAAELAAAAGD